MDTVNNLDKKEVKCNVCNDTGIIHYHDIDGMTIYRWQPYKTKKCEYCDSSKKQ